MTHDVHNVIVSPGTLAKESLPDGKYYENLCFGSRVQELCESRGGRPGLSVLTSLLVSVDVKELLNRASQLVPNMSTDI